MQNRRLSELLSFAGVPHAPELERQAQRKVFALGELSSVAAKASEGPTLIAACLESPEHGRLLRDLSAGGIVGALAAESGEGTIRWSSRGSNVFAELDGLNHRVNMPPDLFVQFAVEPAQAHQYQVLAWLNDRPWLVRTGQAGRETYFLGLTEPPDLDQPIMSPPQDSAPVAAVVAILLFLRAHYPLQVWTPGPALANFIIDDPLLKPKYGFLEHEKLARQVGASNGAATIAFIPWNARRSRRDTARLYRAGGSLSLCVHGNEHTNGEFADTDAVSLRWKAQQSMDRMRLHQELSGVPFEPVMVFPQGKFSTESLDALTSAGFIGAINSHYLSINHDGRARLRDLLSPALMCYGSCPLFARRYPADVERIRYDVILGRPAFLVEHHQYFRDGGADFARTIDRVQQIKPGIEWVSTGQAISRVCMTRHESSGRKQVRFYARRFFFRAGNEPAVYEFQKLESPDVHVRRVTIDGRPVAFSHAGTSLTFHSPLEPHRDVTVSVDAEPASTAAGGPRRPAWEKVRVASRRYLSEFRDDHIHTSRMLSACLTAALKMR